MNEYFKCDLKVKPQESYFTYLVCLTDATLGQQLFVNDVE
jgi:hypothetical protein